MAAEILADAIRDAAKNAAERPYTPGEREEAARLTSQVLARGRRVLAEKIASRGKRGAPRRTQAA